MNAEILVSEIGKLNNLFECHIVEKAIKEKIWELEAKDLEPIPDYGVVYSLDDFTEMVFSRAVCHSDGIGYYATEKEMSQLPFSFSILFPDTFGKKYGFTHVVWFNK